MTDEPRHREPRSAWLLPDVLAVLAVLMLAYVLSYAARRAFHGWREDLRSTVDGRNPATVKAPIDGDDLPVYKPLDWLIDETPLRDPLLWWADVWGVRGTFVKASSWRSSRNHPWRPRGRRP